MKVLITGANGFVGKALLDRLTTNPEYEAIGTVRTTCTLETSGVKLIQTGNLTAETNWEPHLKGINVIVHTAARVHVMDKRSNDSLDEFRDTNVFSTLNLARQAVEASVKRLIFISSIKVNGESTALGKPFTADDTPAPFDPYAISKFEAEEGLRALAVETGMEIVIIRPTLIYGPGVKANFLKMLRWINRGIPLPFGSIHNKRSLVSLDNLIDLIVVCLSHPSATNQIFLAGDGRDLSTTELIRQIGFALSKQTKLIPIPQSIIEFSGALMGRKDLVYRLCKSLQVDISKNKALLDWAPPATVQYALKKTVDHFLEDQRL